MHGDPYPLPFLRNANLINYNFLLVCWPIFGVASAASYVQYKQLTRLEDEPTSGAIFLQLNKFAFLRACLKTRKQYEFSNAYRMS